MANLRDDQDAAQIHAASRGGASASSPLSGRGKETGPRRDPCRDDAEKGKAGRDRSVRMYRGHDGPINGPDAGVEAAQVQVSGMRERPPVAQSGEQDADNAAGPKAMRRLSRSILAQAIAGRFRTQCNGGIGHPLSAVPHRSSAAGFATFAQAMASTSRTANGEHCKEMRSP